MRISQCDICKKQISDISDVRVKIKGIIHGTELCKECGRPIYRFMKKHGFLKDTFESVFGLKK